MLPYADEIIVLDQGRVTAIGSYEEIITQKPEIASKLQTAGEDSHPESPISELPLALEEEKAHVDNRNPTDRGKEDHTRQQGSWSVYRYYFQSAGYTLLFFFLASATIECFCTSFQSKSTLTSKSNSKANLLLALWMQWWVEANEKQSNQQLGRYLGVYAMFFGLTFLAIVAGC
jgi:ATP-binding cassette, subfamily C (CFTR/MRP), member 1